MKVSQLNSEHPTECAVVRQVRQEYADWNYYYDYGYICYNQSGRKRLEHRLVAERAHGLSKHQHVHHIDENPLNNAADNLLPVSGRMHGLIHGKDGINIRPCDHCGKRFKTTHYTIEKKNRRGQEFFFCSPECSSTHNQLGRRGIERPDRETLIADLNELRNWCAVGRKYGVSDNGVRSWARRYEIDASHIDGRK